MALTNQGQRQVLRIERNLEVLVIELVDRYVCCLELHVVPSSTQSPVRSM
jgi:hypothetical protein